MIVLYTFLLTLLNTIRFVLLRRAKALETKYTRVVLAAKKLAGKPDPKRGNTNSCDPYSAARRQFELGRLVHQRDRLESKHFAWQNRYEAFSRMIAGFNAWKGRWIPYLCGFIDVALLLGLAQYVGLISVDLSQLVERMEYMANK